MANRIDLDNRLRTLTKNVYFQPPQSTIMQYPAIIYSLSRIQNINADNEIFKQQTHYKVIVVDKNPESEIVKKLSRFRYCTYSNHYVANNLNHDVFTIII